MSGQIPDQEKVQTVCVPGSKSISHRMLVAACLAKGESRIENLLESQDTALTKNALAAFGANITTLSNTTIVQGVGGHLQPLSRPVFLGNSGTSLRLLAAVAGLGTTFYQFTGDARLCQRPMKELLFALNHLGIKAWSDTNDGTPSVYIKGDSNPRGGRVVLDCARSSQYLSALLFIAPFMEKGLTIELSGMPVSAPYIDLTIDVMKQFQVEVIKKSPVLYHVPAGQIYQPGNFHVEPDVSNAGYFWAAGALTGKQILVENLSTHSLQGDLGQLDIFEKMGCKVHAGSGGIGVQGCGVLNAVQADMKNMPDAVPAIAVTAAFAKGKTRLTNIGHLREKECDRVDALVSQLRKMGIRAEQGHNFLEITGGKPHGARIETFNDHRMVMAFSLAGLCVDKIIIENPSCVDKSFPGYWEIFDQLQSR